MVVVLLMVAVTISLYFIGLERIAKSESDFLLPKTSSCIVRALGSWPFRQSRSSVVEHLLDMEVVGGSIPLATTNSRFLAGGNQPNFFSMSLVSAWSAFQ